MGRGAGLQRLDSGGQGTWAEVEKECHALDQSSLRISSLTLDPDPTGSKGAPVAYQVIREPPRPLTISIPQHEFIPCPPSSAPSLRPPTAARSLHSDIDTLASTDSATPVPPSRPMPRPPTSHLVTSPDPSRLPHFTTMATPTGCVSPSATNPRRPPTPTQPSLGAHPLPRQGNPVSPGVDSNVVEYMFCLEMLHSLKSKPSSAASPHTPHSVKGGQGSGDAADEAEGGEWRRCSSAGRLQEGEGRASSRVPGLLSVPTTPPVQASASSPTGVSRSKTAVRTVYPRTRSESSSVCRSLSVELENESPKLSGSLGTVWPLTMSNVSPSVRRQHAKPGLPDCSDLARSPGSQGVQMPTVKSASSTPKCPAPKAPATIRSSVSSVMEQLQGEGLMSPRGAPLSLSRSQSPMGQGIPMIHQGNVTEICGCSGSVPAGGQSMRTLERVFAGSSCRRGGGEGSDGKNPSCNSPVGEQETSTGGELCPEVLFTGYTDGQTTERHASHHGCPLSQGEKINIMEQWRALPRKDTGSTRYGHLAGALACMEGRMT